MKKYKKLDYNTEDLESLSNSDLKKIADYWLRQYLLKTTAHKYNGWYECPIKNKKYPENQIHVAHFIDRGFSMWTRYYLKNCHLISAQSNTWDAQILLDGYKSKHHYEYEIYLKQMYGDDIITELNIIAENKELFTKENYIKVINKFRNNE